jgi:hypothetical protein
MSSSKNESERCRLATHGSTFNVTKKKVIQLIDELNIAPITDIMYLRHLWIRFTWICSPSTAGNEANKCTIVRQSSRSLRASINVGYLNIKLYHEHFPHTLYSKANSFYPISKQRKIYSMQAGQKKLRTNLNFELIFFFFLIIMPVSGSTKQTC